MKSLQMPQEKMLEAAVPMADTDRVHYPEIYHITGEQMPEINSWEVGEEYDLKVKVRMRSYDKNETFKGTKSSACLEVLAYETEKEEAKEKE